MGLLRGHVISPSKVDQFTGGCQEHSPFKVKWLGNPITTRPHDLEREPYNYLAPSQQAAKLPGIPTVCHLKGQPCNGS